MRQVSTWSGIIVLILRPHTRCQLVCKRGKLMVFCRENGVRMPTHAFSVLDFSVPEWPRQVGKRPGVRRYTLIQGCTPFYVIYVHITCPCLRTWPLHLDYTQKLSHKAVSSSHNGQTDATTRKRLVRVIVGFLICYCHTTIDDWQTKCESCFHLRCFIRACGAINWKGQCFSGCRRW